MRLSAAWTVAVVLGVWSAPARAAQASEQDLGKLSLEDLMQVQVEPVFGATKRVQPVTEAPSSVTIVTADDIAKFGYRTLADILRGVRGLYVSDDRNYSYVGVRGFDRPGDYNTRVLVLVDGHRVNDDVFDQAPIGAELGIDPSTFERVEIIRGPASALYGTSAFFAVINITTKRGEDVKGASVGAEGGSLGTARTYGVFGRHFKDGGDVALSANLEHSDGNGRLFYPEFDSPDTNNGVAVDADSEDVRGLTGRFTFGKFTVTSAYGWRQKHVPTASFDTLFNDSRLATVDKRAWVDGEYDSNWHKTDVTLRTYVDGYWYNGVYPYASLTDDGPVAIFKDYGNGAWWGADGRATRQLGRHQTATAGLEYRDNVSQDQGAAYSDDRVPAWTSDVSTQVFSAYAQDEVRVGHVLMSGGGRYDAYAGFDQVTPRASVVFAPTPTRSFKYLFGSAFRAPNAYEFDYLTNGVRNTALRPETMTSHELVWEEYARRWLRTSVSAYWNNTKDLITLESEGGTNLLLYENIGRVRADGAEFEAEIKLMQGVNVLTSYSVGHAYDRDTMATLTNSPDQLIKFRIDAPGPVAGSTIGAEVLGMSSRLTLAGTTVASSAVTNITYRQPLGSRLELSATARNLFNVSYADPASDEHVQDAIEQDGRTIRIGLGVSWTAK